MSEDDKMPVGSAANEKIHKSLDSMDLASHDTLCHDGKQIRPRGFEPLTLGSEDRCAIQLRHGRVLVFKYAWHCTLTADEFKRGNHSDWQLFFETCPLNDVGCQSV